MPPVLALVLSCSCSGFLVRGLYLAPHLCHELYLAHAWELLPGVPDVSAQVGASCAASAGGMRLGLR